MSLYFLYVWMLSVWVENQPMRPSALKPPEMAGILQDFAGSLPGDEGAHAPPGPRWPPSVSTFATEK